MIIFMLMIFKPSVFLKISVLFTFGIGLVLIVAGIIVFDDHTEEMKITVIPLFIVLPGLFFLLGLFGLRSIKTIECKDDEWVFTYKYRKRVIRLNKDNVWKINVHKKISIGKSLFGEQVFIKNRQGERVMFTSMDIKGYPKLLDLLIADFEENITILK